MYIKYKHASFKKQPIHSGIDIFLAMKSFRTLESLVAHCTLENYYYLSGYLDPRKYKDNNSSSYNLQDGLKYICKGSFNAFEET